MYRTWWLACSLFPLTVTSSRGKLEIKIAWLGTWPHSFWIFLRLGFRGVGRAKKCMFWIPVSTDYPNCVLVRLMHWQLRVWLYFCLVLMKALKASMQILSHKNLWESLLRADLSPVYVNIEFSQNFHKLETYSPFSQMFFCCLTISIINWKVATVRNRIMNINLVGLFLNSLPEKQLYHSSISHLLYE